MFDKLVESDMTGADLKPRRRIFIASFAFVAVLFATAVVAGIYAADYTLGTDNFDIAEMLAPVAAAEPEEPEPPREQSQNRRTTQNDQTTRQTNMARVDEPDIVPTGVSVQKNQFLSRPPGDFLIRKGPETNAAPPDDFDRPGRADGSGSRSSFDFDDGGDASAKTPPPVAPKPVKPKGPISGGVMTGKATSLPKPVYSAAAKAVNARGTVTVQITVDEFGRVISAKAIDGHILLRPAAVDAAWKAKFDPTTLSNVPVKVTGMIVYNFTR